MGRETLLVPMSELSSADATLTTMHVLLATLAYASAREVTGHAGGLGIVYACLIVFFNYCGLLLPSNHFKDTTS